LRKGGRRVGIFCKRKNYKSFKLVVVGGWKEAGKKEGREKVKRKGYLGWLAVEE